MFLLKLMAVHFPIIFTYVGQLKDIEPPVQSVMESYKGEENGMYSHSERKINAGAMIITIHPT